MSRILARRVGITLAVGLVAFASRLIVLAWTVPTVGEWAAIGTVTDARTGAASVTLPDGRTLVAGGMVDGSATDSVVVYDPVANEFSTVGQLPEARTGHTATLLADGTVLIVGGTVNELISSDIFAVDPSSGTSTPIITGMANPRTGHAAARLGDDTVLIVGGSTVEGVILQSAEIFDPATGSVTALQSGLATPRTGASATTLIDGRVLIAGGSDGTQDLASAEVYEGVSQAFEPATTELSVGRSGHTAVLLPHNNSVLIAGGSSGGAPQSVSDLFLPALFPDPYSYGMGTFAASGSMAAARSGAVGGSSVADGHAFVAGGGPSDAEVYGFATIKTDKDDYAPGELAVISGSGWLPGEAVKLIFQEDPAVHLDYVIDRDENGDPIIVADENGSIYYDQWAPEQHDLGVRFYLMAIGGQSRAQTTFTDASNYATTTTLNAIATPLTTSQAAVAFSGQVVPTSGADPQVPDGATVRLAFKLGTCTGNFALSATATTTGNNGTFAGTFTAPSGAGSYSYRAEFVTYSQGSGSTGENWQQSNSAACRTVVVEAAAATTTTVASSLNPSTYGDSVTFTATVTSTSTPTGSVNFVIDGGGPVAGAVGATTATTATWTYTTSTLNVAGSPHSVSASYVHSGLFQDSSGSLSGGQQVNARAVTLTGTRAYDGTTNAAAAILTVSNAVGADVVTVASGTATLVSKDVGLRAITSLGDLALGGADVANYTLTGATGSVTITERVVTLTGTRAYDGTTNAAAAILTVSNAVGADVVTVASGTATLASKDVGLRAITSLGDLALGGADVANYTLTGATGSVTITERVVTLTGTRAYDGTTNAAAAILTVSNAVGADVVTVASGTATLASKDVGLRAITSLGDLALGGADVANYTLTGATGSVNITKAMLVVTASSHTVNYHDPVPTVTPSYAGFVGSPLETTAVLDTPPICTTTYTNVSPVSGSPYTTSCSGGLDNNYEFSYINGSVTVEERDALVRYIGQTSFVTSGTSSTTAQVTLSASVQDPSGAGLVNATVSFIDVGTGKTLASGVTVSPVAGSSSNTGTANKVVTLSTGQYGAESYLILVKMTGNYDNEDQDADDKTATVVVSKPATTNETIGAGTITGLTDSAGIYRSDDDATVTYTVGMKYNKSGTNLQGKITLTIPQADGSVIYVNSNSISSMAVASLTSPAGKRSTIYTKASIYKVNGATTTTLDGNVTLRVDALDFSSTSTPDQVGFTVLSSKNSELFYSNQWVLDAGATPTGTSAWKTVTQGINLPGSCLKIN